VQTFAQTVQAAIFFPSGNYGRVSGIMGLLANENSAVVSPIPGAVAYIFDEQQLYNEARAIITLSRSPTVRHVSA